MKYANAFNDGFCPSTANLFVPPGFGWDEWVQSIEDAESILINASQKNYCFTYTGFFQQLPQLGIRVPSYLANLFLCQVCCLAHVELGAMVTVAVVRAGTRFPGRGFFTLAEELGYAVSNRFEFVLEQRRKLRTYFDPLETEIDLLDRGILSTDDIAATEEAIEQIDPEAQAQIDALEDMDELFTTAG